MTSRISDSIKILRFPLVALVVFIHIPRVPDANECYRIVTSFFSCRISGVAVPMFFAMSGYLFFASGFNGTIYKEKLKHRVRSLLLPYILWNLVAFVLLVTPNVRSYEFTFRNILVSFWDCHNSFINASSHSPIDFPLWYVRDLMVCVILSPIVYYVVKQLRIIAPAALVICWLSGLECNIPGISVISLTFFSLGAYMALYETNAIDDNKGLWSTCCLCLFLLLNLLFAVIEPIAGLTYWAKGTAFLGVICIPSFVCTLLERYPDIGYVSNKLSSMSFFLYASHTIIIK